MNKATVWCLFSSQPFFSTAMTNSSQEGERRANKGERSSTCSGLVFFYLANTHRSSMLLVAVVVSLLMYVPENKHIFHLFILVQKLTIVDMDFYFEFISVSTVSNLFQFLCEKIVISNIPSEWPRYRRMIVLAGSCAGPTRPQYRAGRHRERSSSDQIQNKNQELLLRPILTKKIERQSVGWKECDKSHRIRCSDNDMWIKPVFSNLFLPDFSLK